MSTNDEKPTDSVNIDSELIGMVYEIAFDPNFWPDLLEGISGLLEDKTIDDFKRNEIGDDRQQTTAFYSDSLAQNEEQRLAILLPHLCRALKLKREYNNTDHSLHQARAIIDQFPFGVLMVNTRRELISVNPYALETIGKSHSLFLKNNQLFIKGKQAHQQLEDGINQAAKPLEHNVNQQKVNAHITLIKLGDEYDSPPVSLLISPDLHPTDTYDKQAEHYAIIFIASASVRQQISPLTLQLLFNLTPAEASLASLLASGMSLSQAAEHNSISRNTAKVQLKSIFTKTGVSRQSELIKLILTSPAVFSSATQPSENSPLKKQVNETSHINLESHIKLKDGRRLQYAEYGDPRGKPVVYIHGALGCRYERLPNDRLTRQMGIRLVIPDRPGYGLSDPVPNHSYLDFVDDLQALLAHLNIEKFSIMGLSVGAIYAMAFAYKMPHKLQHIAMVSSTPPFRCFADYEEIQPSLKLLIAFSKYVPSAAQMIAKIAIKNACKNPQKFFANIPLSPSDLDILSNPLLTEHFIHCLLSGSQRCHNGFVQDIMISAEPWPFAFEEIKNTIDFWHGTQDTHSPLNRMKPVIDGVKNKRLHKIEGGGHFLIYNHWQAILQLLIR